ncbi:MAG: hypothetical protein ACOVOD_16000 [Rhodoferax sp.]
MTEGKKTIPSESSPIEAVIAPEGQADKHLTSRRRLIKLGGVAAPVALTLTSRPVMAWHCNTTSAWGSAQINPNASTTARNKKNELVDETWTIENWKHNTTRAGLPSPWTALGQSFNVNIQTSNPSGANYYKNFTAAWLFASVGLPTGIGAHDKLWDKICNGSQWQKYMIVARMNTRLITNVKSCLTSSTHVDQLRLMATGTYSPSNLGGVVWNQAMIIQYLEQNWIVRAA